MGTRPVGAARPRSDVRTTQLGARGRRGRHAVRRVAALAIAAVLALARLANAEDSDDARLRARLGPELAAPVLEIIHSAAAQGLPTAPLVSRALEGASRQADGAAIVA